MIHFDVTNSASWRHRSGLARVCTRLREELGAEALEARWPAGWSGAGKADWLLTAELFCEAERPGLGAFLGRRPCRLAAIFHDAIPIKLPHITWPASVARHPEYMKLLARFDRVWAVSAASRDDLIGFWAWQGVGASAPRVEVLSLGADFDGVGAGTRSIQSGGLNRASGRRLLAVGILEPRKNQGLLLDVCDELWGEGLVFELHLVGRVNPHFGRPIEMRIREMRGRREGLWYHGSADDARVAELYETARAAVFPTIAEGCGLPLLESLWQGVPCVCGDIPPLLENAAGGGCLTVATNDRAAWKAALRSILTDDALQARLAAEATSRSLSTWAEAAATLRDALE